MNGNKHFPSPNNTEFHEALEKALKSLKTRKWSYNRKRQQIPLHEENEEFPQNQRRRMDNVLEQNNIEFEDSQEQVSDTSQLEDIHDETMDADVIEMDDDENENLQVLSPNSSPEQEYLAEDGPHIYDETNELFFNSSKHC